MSDFPKVPCIALSTTIVTTNNDPLISKIDSIPYIDKHSPYPEQGDKPMICIAQLNMDQIWDLLQNKKSKSAITKYFRMYPKTGLLQFYLPYSEKLTDDEVHIKYIPKYKLENHDMKKQCALEKIYSRYRKHHGTCFMTPDDVGKNYSVYITDAIYGYDYLNSSLWQHPDFEEDMEDKETKYLGTYDRTDNTIHIGGFPYCLQDGMEFDENDDAILLTITNSLLGLNIGIKKSNLKKLNFDEALFDLSYD
jgi:uncharacterized protein YwqG